MKKYFINVGKPTKTKTSNIVDPITISKEQYDYFQRAHRYAQEHGFKIKLFDENGKCYGMQG